MLGILVAVMLVSGAQAQHNATEKPVRVEIKSTAGTLVVELFNETPQHRDNFIKLVKEGAYDSLLFHRVIPAFMVQGGDPDSKRAKEGAMLGNGGPGYTLKAEIVPGLIHRRGALAAARLPDPVNPGRDSNGSQFFIVHGKTFQPRELDLLAQRSARMGTPVSYTPEQQAIYASEGGAPHLDGAYTVFGQLVEGFEVLDVIAAMPCDERDRPLSDIRIFMRLLP
jgi:cyclophilin family peptidyl-prolyl cis-trans isomerase